MTDQIAKAMQAPGPESREGAEVRLPSGRVVTMQLPVNMTDAEMFDLIAVLGTQIRPQIRSREAGQLAGRVALPGGGVLPVRRPT